MSNLGLLLLVILIVSCAGEDSFGKNRQCTTLNRCKILGKRSGVDAFCQPKGDECDGKLYNGRKYCRSSKRCACCVPDKVHIVSLQFSASLGGDILIRWNPGTPTPPPIPTSTDQPTSSEYSRCGVKGPNRHTLRVRANNNNVGGESKPFIEDLTWGNPPRNDSIPAEIVRKIKEANPLLEGRITFGKPAGPQEYPWQVGMKVWGRFHCGASIIGDQHILTAAHCVTKYKRTPQSLYLTLGDYDLSTPNEQSNEVPTVESVMVHPSYSPTTLRNDLAVLKLTKKIKFKSNIQKICLAPLGFDPTGKIAIVTGWGRNEANRLESKLQELASEVDNNAYCAGQWEKFGAPRDFITKDMMCMSSIGGDSCSGDSGGPSVMEIDGTYYQIGIVSFGSGSCVDESLPGVYTRVTSYRDWIVQQMN